MNYEDILKSQWHDLTDSTNALSGELWNKIIASYTNANRYYHNLNHIGSMVDLAHEYSNEILNQKAFRFAIFYHDLIYDTSRNDNEERSAECASNDLQKLHLDKSTIGHAISLIRATQYHNEQHSEDSNLFIDMDLAILGSAKELYEQYMHNIRKEYSLFNDMQYRKGRIDVLHYFLNMRFIYKTALFRTRFEQNARRNIHFELSCLT
jgi:predicted metal-dependent HD superfamily phosphohydrolase